jgi:peptidoglycan/LPS O-acetylase OafA/YrhL
MAGALLALLVRSRSFVPSRFLIWAWISFFVSGSLAIVIDKFHARWMVFSFVVIASLALVYISLFSKQAALQSILTNRLLVYTGSISYGIYLLEKIPVDVAEAFHLERYPYLAFPIATAATFVLATLSWKLVEAPILRLRRFVGGTVPSELSTTKIN